MSYAMLESVEVEKIPPVRVQPVQVSSLSAVPKVPLDVYELRTTSPWVSCLVFLVATTAVIAATITSGVVIGYTYSCIEHHHKTIHRDGQGTGPIEQLPAIANKTINNAITSVLGSNLFSVGELWNKMMELLSTQKRSSNRSFKDYFKDGFVH